MFQITPELHNNEPALKQHSLSAVYYMGYYEGISNRRALCWAHCAPVKIRHSDGASDEWSAVLDKRAH